MQNRILIHIFFNLRNLNVCNSEFGYLCLAMYQYFICTKYMNYFHIEAFFLLLPSNLCVSGANYKISVSMKIQYSNWTFHELNFTRKDNLQNEYWATY